jgi:hypothetical protein
MNLAKTTAKKVCRNIIKTAPVAKIKALVLPSKILTFAAVILIKPGGIIPIVDVRKPKKSGKVKFITL